MAKLSNLLISYSNRILNRKIQVKYLLISIVTSHSQSKVMRNWCIAINACWYNCAQVIILRKKTICLPIKASKYLTLKSGMELA